MKFKMNLTDPPCLPLNDKAWWYYSAFYIIVVYQKGI